jgi:tyrosine-protein kinase Etk/Wzc
MESEIVNDTTETPAIGVENRRPREFHLLDILVVLSRRRRLILWTTVGVAIATAIFVVLIPNQYTAETLVLPPGQNASNASALLGQLLSSSTLASVAGSSLGIKTPGEMYVSLFQTEIVMDAMIQRFGLMSRYHAKKMSEARKVFSKNARVSLGPKDGLIKIRVTDRDPRFAADLANGYVDQFRKLSESLAITEASQRRAFFEQQLLEANQNLATAEEAMKHTQITTGVLQVDSQARLLIESAASLRAQIVAKEVELQAFRSSGTEQNPRIVTALEELSALKSQLAKLTGSEDTNSDLIVPKGKIPEAGLEYLRSLRDVRYYETIREIIARQFEIAKLDEARQGAMVQVADPAIPPDNHSSPLRTISVILASFVGFFAACWWCILVAKYREMDDDPVAHDRLMALRATFRKG